MSHNPFAVGPGGMSEWIPDGSGPDERKRMSFGAEDLDSETQPVPTADTRSNHQPGTAYAGPQQTHLSAPGAGSGGWAEQRTTAQPASSFGSPGQQGAGFPGSHPGSAPSNQAPQGWGTPPAVAPGQVPGGPSAPVAQAWSGGQPAQVAPERAPQSKRRAGFATVLVASIFSALLVGGAAGYGGALLALRNQPQAQVAQPDQPQSSLPPAPPAANVTEVANKVLPSTVTIALLDGERQVGTGSGIVFDAEGHILTNNHVVQAAAEQRASLEVEFTDGRREPAEIVGRSPSYDLAVIRVQPFGELVPATLGDSSKVVTGQAAIALGAPLGLGSSVTEGIISATDRPVVVGDATEDGTAYINGLQTDAAINPGNSGGPLADAGGNVIGVNSAILTTGGSGETRGGSIGLGFAIPINQARSTAEQLIANGRAVYPVIGATVSTSTDGVRVGTVEPGGPAETAGIRNGDIIEAIDGRRVTKHSDLIVRVRTFEPGQTVTLTVRDRGDIPVVLGSKEG